MPPLYAEIREATQAYMARESLNLTDMAEGVGVTFTSMRTFLNGTSVLREPVLELLVAVLRDAGLLRESMLPDDFPSQLREIVSAITNQDARPRTAAALHVLKKQTP